MARANTPTYLALDDWAKHIGINRWMFNGFTRIPGVASKPCEQTWFQHAEQTDTFSREEVAFAIQQAEEILSDYLRFNLAPKYEKVIIAPTEYYNREYTFSRTARLQQKAVELPKGKIVQLGRKVSKFLEQVPIVRIDKDGDGFAETGQITLTNWGVADLNQLKIYYPDKNGEDGWEIRPVKYISPTLVEIQMYQVPNGDLIESLQPTPLPIDDPASFLTEVDLYQVYTDTTNPITLKFETGEIIETGGQIRNRLLGFVTYDNCSYYEPLEIEVNVLSGWESQTPPTYKLDSRWEKIIAYFSLSFLPTPLTDCNGNLLEINSYGKDLVLQEDLLKYGITTEMLNNPLGVATKGAWYAYKRVQQFRI